MPYEWEEWAMRALIGIEPYEVRQVLEAGRRWPRPGANHSTGVRVLTIWGRTRAGRGLVREMTDGELAEFVRWEETR